MPGEVVRPSASPGADAGFVGVDLFCELLEAGVQVLVRGHRGVRLLSDAPAGAIEPRGDGQVYLWPQNRRGQSPLALRLIVLKILVYVQEGPW